MATFNVKLGSNEGELSFRQVHGNTSEEVRRNLQGEGFFVFSVKPAFNPTSLVGLERKVPLKKFLLFNKEFRGLIKAGLPIVEGFDILLARMKKGRLRGMLEGVREKLRMGESLSEAFKAFEHLIPAYYPALLHAGEQSGNLEEVLGRFIKQEERLRKTRKKFLQSLTYPSILLLVGLGSMYVILTRAMPQFAAMYSNQQETMPLITRMVIAASDWMVVWYPFLFGGILVFVFALRLFVRTDRGARTVERVWWRIPLLGHMWRLQNQNIFARTMRLLLGGGVPVPQAMSITSGALPSPAFRHGLRAAYDELQQGHTLQDALEEHLPGDDMVGEMVRVGEATGTLGEMLEYLADAGEEQAEDHLELISSTIAPVMLLFVGLGIAVLVVAMYLPMFSSYSAL